MAIPTRPHLRRFYAVVLAIITPFSWLTVRLIVGTRQPLQTPRFYFPALGASALLVLITVLLCRWLLRACHAWCSRPSPKTLDAAVREIRSAPWVICLVVGVCWMVFKGGLYLLRDAAYDRSPSPSLVDFLDLGASGLATVTVIPLVEWLLRPLSRVVSEAAHREGISTLEGTSPLGVLLLVYTAAMVLAPALSIAHFALSGQLALPTLMDYLPIFGVWIALSTFGLSRFVLSPLRDALMVVGAVTREDGTIGPERIPLTNSEEFAQFALAVNEMLDRLTATQGELALRLTERERLSEEARIALRTRDEFINIAAHELRTPLTVLQLHLDSLTPESFPSGARERSHRQVRRLTALVDSLLDVSRIQVGKLELQPELLGLNDFLREQLASQDACQLSLELLPSVVEVDADRARLEQVLANLVSNARRYAPEGTPVVVRLWKDNKEAGFSVEDQGPGIAVSERERVFDRFYRAEGARRSKSGGLGLGLYICRSIVTAHGGRIWASESQRGGAAIHVRLPRRIES